MNNISSNISIHTFVFEKMGADDVVCPSLGLNEWTMDMPELLSAQAWG
jgi:hypothetical protein